jgi:UMF1 family MFS transporter
MLGKFAAIIGPALMAIVGLLVRRMLMPPAPTAEQLISVGQVASRWSMGSILILFIVGMVLFYFVDEEKGREQANYLADR